LGGWVGLTLVVLLGGAHLSEAQDPPRPPRPPEVMKIAIDTYKRGDFETAASLFAQAQLNRDELDTNERLDLETFSSQNRAALAARQEGAAQIYHAEEALNQGRTADAAKLLKTVAVNQYLSPADRQALAGLQGRLQSGKAAAPTAGAKADPKALLAAARSALQNGDLSGAEFFATEAEKAGGGSSWLQPWADTPAKVQRDIQAARAKQTPVLVKGTSDVTEKKDGSWSLPIIKNFFVKDPPAGQVSQPEAYNEDGRSRPS
jgi:hypothetical protein